MLSWENVHAAVRPLRMIFWGGLLWIFDVTFTSTTNGQGFRFDILNDTLATILITIGVFSLAGAPVGGRFASVMMFVKVVALLSIAETALKHFVFAHSAPLDFTLGLLSLAQLVATILFCLAMRWFCEAAGVPDVARSWHATFLLFCVLYAAPLGIFYALGLLAMSTGSSFHIDLGVAGLLLVVVFAIPLVHLFVSTSRMKRAAESGRAGNHAAPGGFPVAPIGESDA
jgi:hypothetical protein